MGCIEVLIFSRELGPTIINNKREETGSWAPTPTPTLIDQIDGSLLSGCAKVIALVPEFDYSTQGRSTQSHHPTS